MGFEVDVAGVSGTAQGGDLLCPLNTTVAHSQPLGSGARDTAIFGMDVADARHGEERETLERIFPGQEGVGRIPYQLQIGMIHGGQDARRFEARGDVAGVLIFESDGDAMFRSLPGEGA
jgi:hypothetical protein